jgi:hypothetical protein
MEIELMRLYLPEAEDQITFLKRAIPNMAAMIATQFLLVDGGVLVCYVHSLFDQVHG